MTTFISHASLFKTLLLLSISALVFAPTFVSASPVNHYYPRNGFANDNITQGNLSNRINNHPVHFNQSTNNLNSKLPFKLISYQNAGPTHYTTAYNDNNNNTNPHVVNTSATTIGTITSADVASPGAVFDTAQICQSYSLTANLSAIGSNATIRSTFLDVSPVGRLSASALLNNAMHKLPTLASDAQLNQACGNLSTLADTEVGRNFSNGVVGEFLFEGNHVAITSGPIVAVVSVLCLVLIVGPATVI
ncbi:hypothetical protein BD289DRAFT_450449 [Coniella lustricola]|uniref:Uncharacterized protein n=1 Tax=Coniella lustricola TaxID=2025994 RepID=A0A2T3AIC6_9PEZI|nr:hypothetical protein BD289DRAFT_450449 [Coniella lustricola]